VIRLRVKNYPLLLFEEMELVGGFAHLDKPDDELLPYAFGLYYNKILPEREKN